VVRGEGARLVRAEVLMAEPGACGITIRATRTPQPRVRLPLRPMWRYRPEDEE